MDIHNDSIEINNNSIEFKNISIETVPNLTETYLVPLNYPRQLLNQIQILQLPSIFWDTIFIGNASINFFESIKYGNCAKIIRTTTPKVGKPFKIIRKKVLAH